MRALEELRHHGRMFLVLQAAMLFVASAGDEDRPAPWQSLFDGSTLDGWRGVRGEIADWTPAHGVLAWKGGDGARWIASENTYADFELDLEFNYEAGCNSGVFFRTPMTTGRPAFEGNEVQIVDESDTELAAKMTDDRRMGALYSVQPPQNFVAAAPGRWHRLRIRCQGTRCRATLNGEIILDRDFSDYSDDLKKEHPGLSRRDGHIGLQSKPGSVIAFRNLRIRILENRP